tara:strand:+ start:61 stop:1119 length:1059 start_codon:yes stop_codon:yes gene_type:complete
MLLISVASIGAILWEIPSGIFADYFGRKPSIVLGMFVLSLGYVGVSFSHNFLSFLIAYFVVSIGIALVSGADTALLYDSLRIAKKEDTFKKVLGRAHTFSNLGFAGGALVGGIVAQFGFRTNYYLFAFSIFLGFLASLLLVEPKAYEKITTPGLQHLKNSLAFSFNHKRVRWLIIYYGVMFGSMGSLFTLWQPYMKAVSIDVSYFGYAYVLFLMAASLTSFFAHSIEKSIGEKASLILIALFISLPIILLGTYLFIFGLIFMILVEFSFGYLRPVFNDYVNKHIVSSQRATVLSIGNMFMRFCWAIIGPVIGFIADNYSMQHSLVGYGVFLLVLSPFILVPLLKTSSVKQKA